MYFTAAMSESSGCFTQSKTVGMVILFKLIMVLISIFLITNDAKHLFFVCLFTISVSSLVKCQIFCTLKISGVLKSYCYLVERILSVFQIRFLSDKCFADIFSQAFTFSLYNRIF